MELTDPHSRAGIRVTEHELDNCYLTRKDPVQTGSLRSQTEGTRSQTKSQEPRFACGSFFKLTARFHTASSTDWDERERRAAQSHAYPTFMSVYELPSME